MGKDVLFIDLNVKPAMAETRSGKGHVITQKLCRKSRNLHIVGMKEVQWGGRRGGSQA